MKIAQILGSCKYKKDVKLKYLYVPPYHDLPLGKNPSIQAVCDYIEEELIKLGFGGDVGFYFHEMNEYFFVNNYIVFIEGSRQLLTLSSQEFNQFFDIGDK